MAKAGPKYGGGSPEDRHARSAGVRSALVNAAIDALRETGFAGASARESLAGPTAARLWSSTTSARSMTSCSLPSTK